MLGWMIPPPTEPVQPETHRTSSEPQGHFVTGLPRYRAALVTSPHGWCGMGARSALDLVRVLLRIQRKRPGPTLLFPALESRVELPYFLA